MWSRAVIKEKAKERVRANYWPMVLAALVMSISLSASSGVSRGYNQWSGNIRESDLTGTQMIETLGFVLTVLVILSVVSLVVTVLVFNPLQVGAVRYFYKNINGNADLGELGYGFRKNWSNIVGIMFLRNLFIFLWSLLLIVPGIIKAYEYRMVPYLLAEDSSMSREDAFAISKRMMTGNKLDAFVFDLSFFGWLLLAVCTCGILSIFYVAPYMFQAQAMLYDAIKHDDGFSPRSTQENIDGFSSEPTHEEV